jgi:hypothetical protein
MLQTTSGLRSSMLGLFRRCSNCNANLGLPAYARRNTWCPFCSAFLNPQATWLGPTDRLICIDAVHKQSEPVSKLFGMLAVLGLSSGADQLVLEPGDGKYRLCLQAGSTIYEMVEPPFTLRQRLQDVARAIGGVELVSDGLEKIADLKIRNTEVSPAEDWPMVIEILPGLHGDTIVLNYTLHRELDQELISSLCDREAYDAS